MASATKIVLDRSIPFDSRLSAVMQIQNLEDALFVFARLGQHADDCQIKRKLLEQVWKFKKPQKPMNLN